MNPNNINSAPSGLAEKTSEQNISEETLNRKRTQALGDAALDAAAIQAMDTINDIKQNTSLTSAEQQPDTPDASTEQFNEISITHAEHTDDLSYPKVFWQDEDHLNITVNGEQYTLTPDEAVQQFGSNPLFMKEYNFLMGASSEERKDSSEPSSDIPGALEVPDTVVDITEAEELSAPDEAEFESETDTEEYDDTPAEASPAALEVPNPEAQPVNPEFAAATLENDFIIPAAPSESAVNAETYLGEPKINNPGTSPEYVDTANVLEVSTDAATQPEATAQATQSETPVAQPEITSEQAM